MRTLLMLLVLLCVPGLSLAEEEFRHWSLGIGFTNAWNDFEDRFPDEDAFISPRPGMFRGDQFDHVGSSQTGNRFGRDQVFDYEDLRTVDLSLEYRPLRWLGFELGYMHMTGLEFSRPRTNEVAYYRTGRALTFENGAGVYCDAGCDRYALDLQGFSYEGKGEIEGYLGMLNVKLYGPEFLRGRIEPFALIGGGMMRVEARESGSLSEFEATRGYFAPQPPTGQDLGAILPVDSPIPNDPYFVRDIPGGYSVRTTETEPVLNLEIGMIVNVTDWLAVDLRGSYKRPTGVLEEFDFFTLGTRFLLRF